MSGISGGVVPLSPNYKTFTANLNQAAATYDLCTATGDVLIKIVTIFVAVAAIGLTSISISSNNTTADVVLASTLLATLTVGKNLTPVSLPFLLPSTKKIQYTIVGVASAGSLTIGLEVLGGTLA